MGWNEGYAAQFYITNVDPYSWRDLNIIDITGGNVSKNADGLMESANINLTENIGERIIRVYIVTQSETGGDRAAIFTGFAQTPSVQWDGVRESYNAVCYSVLKASSDILLPRGWYADKGANAAEVARDLLSVLAPVTIEGTAPKLDQYLVAESGETQLSMAQKILKSIGWRIRIEGDGAILLTPQTTEPSARFDSEIDDIVELSVTDEQDLYSCPNVFRATSGDSSAVARNEASIQERMREIWAEDDRVVPNDGESLEEYALRRLIELQSPARRVTYNRRYLPDVVPGDVVTLSFSGQRVEGNFRVQRQRITLGYNATVSEEVEQI